MTFLSRNCESDAETDLRCSQPPNTKLGHAWYERLPNIGYLFSNRRDGVWDPRERNIAVSNHLAMESYQPFSLERPQTTPNVYCWLYVVRFEAGEPPIYIDDPIYDERPGNGIPDDLWS